MRTFKPLFFLLLAVLMISCNGNTVYKEFNRDFSENRWMKSDSRDYMFEIEKSGKYDILVDFSHVYDTPLKSAPIRVQLSSGNKMMFDESVAITIRDEDGKQVGDCTGDVCDIRQTIIPSRTLPAGQYRVKLMNEFDFEYLPNFLGIGIRVAKSN